MPFVLLADVNNADCETSVYNGKLQKDERKKKLTLSA
jgi:hypothetical protein